MRRRLLPLVLVSLMLTSSMSSVLGASGREVVDNWDDGDAFVEISLISWVANQTEEWDSSGGLPDPQFRICFDVDGENLDCVNTPTWENQWELNATWNYTIDIPDTSNLLNITIECEDNDAFNDDECDMNADVNEWKLYAEYNWSQNPNMTISGNGDGDGNGTWKNAASVWEVKVFGFGDEDGDGVSDNADLCPGTSETNLLSDFPGCAWGQLDFDADGVENSEDLVFQDFQITTNFPFLFENYNSNTPQLIEITGIDSSGGSQNGASNTFFKTTDGSEFLIQTRGNNQIFRLSGEANLDFETIGGSAGPTNLAYSNVVDLDLDGDLDLVVSPKHFFINENNTLVEQEIPSAVWYNRDAHCDDSDYEILDFDRNGNFDFYCDGIVLLNFGFTSESTESTIISICEEKSHQEHEYHYEQLSDTWLFICLEENERGTEWVDHNITRVSRQGAYLNSYTIAEIETGPYRTGFFGDFNNDGYVDYIHNAPDTTEKEIVISFSNSQGWSSSTPIGIFHYWYVAEASAIDVDGDGDIDVLGSDGSTLIQGEFGFEFVEYTLPGVSSRSRYFTDYDGDGDLDYLYTGQHNSEYGLFLVSDPSYPDSDGDGISDSNDICPQSNSDAQVNQDGCSDSQRDTDADGISDATDQCPNTPLGYPVNLEGCGTNQLDSDGDGISDAMDLCPATPAGESTNLEGCSQSEVDSDADGVVNSNDACPGTAQGSIVDANGCSESDVVDNDADGDGVVDTYDACPSTIVGSTVDQNGCSDAQLDLDGDGVPNTRDQCPGTSSGAEVSYYGCTASQGDEDLDGVLNVDDDCPGSWFVDKDNPPETSNGCDGMLESQDDDDDGDGLVNTYDECPDTPAGQSVDDQGCTASQRNTLADDAASEGDAGDTIAGMFCCFGLLWLVFSASTKSRKKSSSPPRYVQVPQQVIHQQSVHQQQQVMRELENQRRQAEQQVAQLQQQLHQSNQMSAAQLASVQSQLADMQQQVTATNMAKADMQRELEQMKIQEVERNTLTESPVNIQDSAVAGDSLIGSTKIENQTVNDADAIARAAAAAAIDAYRMGLDDRER